MSDVDWQSSEWEMVSIDGSGTTPCCCLILTRPDVTSSFVRVQYLLPLWGFTSNYKCEICGNLKVFDASTCSFKVLTFLLSSLSSETDTLYANEALSFDLTGLQVVFSETYSKEKAGNVVCYWCVNYWHRNIQLPFIVSRNNNSRSDTISEVLPLS